MEQPLIHEPGTTFNYSGGGMTVLGEIVKNVANLCGDLNAMTDLPFPWRKLAPVYVTALAGMAIFFVFPVQVSFYLSAHNDVSSGQVGLALSLQTLASVFFALQYQHLRTRYSFLAIFGLIFPSFSLNHCLVSLSSSYIFVIAGLLIGGAGIGLFAPNNGGWLSSLAPAAVRGKAVGGMTSILFLGQFFLPIITQPIVNQVGLAATLAVAGVAVLERSRWGHIRTSSKGAVAGSCRPQFRLLADQKNLPPACPTGEVRPSQAPVWGKDLESSSDATSPRQTCLYQRSERRSSPIDPLSRAPDTSTMG